MNRYALIFIVALFSACSSTSQNQSPLAEGRWTGYLTPMNHPEMQNPVGYEVTYESKDLNIELVGPGAQPVPTKNPHVHGDTLYFSFSEPEEGVMLECRLASVSEGEAAYKGRCIDPSGKWAVFAMIPPKAK